jgi:hypothetical protein
LSQPFPPDARCAFCSRRYVEHDEARAPGLPDPRCGCLLLRQYFAEAGSIVQAQRAEPQRTGAERIAAERQRQIDKEGWTASHDDDHDDGDLVLAAVSYAAQAADVGDSLLLDDGMGSHTDPWPWDPIDDKRAVTEGGCVAPSPRDEEHRIRLLEKAGALIAAELDRLLRATGDRDG